MKINYILKRLSILLSFVFLLGFTAQSQCTHTLVMTDSWGDGWNGASVTVNVNGTPVLTAATVATGSSATATFTASNGDAITTVWTSGSYDSECTYQILDGAGVQIGSDGPTPTGITTGVSGACPTCPPPSNISSSNITDSSATISWTTGGSANWNIEYGPSGFTPGTGTIVSTITNPHSLTNLNGLTGYDVYLQDSCAIGDVSSWIGPVSFYTSFSCATGTAIDVLSENWDAGQGLWTGDFGTSNGTWQFESGTTGSSGTGPTGPHNGTQYLYFEASGSSSQTAAVVTPAVDLSAGVGSALLSFFAHGYGSDIPGSTLKVGVSTSPTGTFNYVIDTTFASELQAADSDPYAKFMYDLSAYVGQVIYLEFEYTSSDAYEADLALDMITVSTCITCPPPSNLTVNNIANTSADVDWTTGGSATWNLEYVMQGQTLGSGTLISNITTKPYTLSGLNTAEYYDVYVQDSCGVGDVSPWTGPLSFNTTASPLNGTYTIGDTAGGASYDYPSFTSAAQHLNIGGVSGAVSFIVATDTYTEQVIIDTIPGASATNTITFTSLTGDSNDVVLQASMGSTSEAVLLFNNTDYVTFSNMTIKAETGSSYGRVVQFDNGSHNNQLLNNIIETEVSTSSSFAPIYSYGSIDNNNTISNNHIKNGYYGIYWRGSGSSDRKMNNTIENNIIEGYYYYGIYAYYNTGLVINNNYVQNGSNSGSVYGIYNYYSDFYEFTNNQVHIAGTSTHYGYYSRGEGSAINPIKINNNIINLNGSGTGTWYGMYIYYTDTAEVYHNSVSILEGSTSSGRAIYTYNGDALDIKNNIFANYGGGYAFYTNSTSNVASMDYNAYYTSGSDLAYWSGAKADLAALQTANSMDANSIQADPVYASIINNDLTPLNFAIDNIGTPTSITTDIFGATRSTTTPDVGAMEFTGLSADMAILDGMIINGECLSTNDSVYVQVSNSIGTQIDFSTDALTIAWDVTGPVNSNGTFTINSGTLDPAVDTIFGSNGVDLSVPGDYTLSVYIQANAVNTYAGNDTLNNHYMLTVIDPFVAMPAYSTVNNSTSTVELSVNSPYLPAEGFFFTEICHYAGTSTGEPSGGQPTYLGDDYVEITGAPNSDISGFTFEKWGPSDASPDVTHTFPAGTTMSPNGTYLLSTYQGTTSLADYHQVADVTSSYSSGGDAINILKDTSGNIVDVVLYETNSTIPAAAGVTTEWTGPGISGSGSWGIRLTGADTDDNTNWVEATQDPNVANSGVTVPTGIPLSGFSWTYNGVVGGTNVDTIVGPYTTTGTHQYIANYTSASCGAQADTAVVDVFIPAPLVVSNDTTICAGDSINLSVTFNGTAPFTMVATDGTSIDTIPNIPTANFVAPVSPADTTTYVILEFWDAMNIPVPTNDSITVNVKPLPSVSMTAVADLCESAVAVALNGVPSGGTFTGMGVIGSSFDPAIAGDGSKAITYSYTASNGCSNDTTIIVNVLPTPNINITDDLAICDGDSTLLTVNSSISDPYFSEYQEGSSNHKAVEIYNGTGAAINLDDYAILTNYNGNPWSGIYTFPIGTTLADGDVYVIANESADSAGILVHADEELAYNAAGYMMGYNGDDVRALVKFESNGDTTIIDLIGLYDMIDPGSGWDVAGVSSATANHTLVRKPDAGPNYGDFTASQGNDSLSSEWLVYPQNTWTYLGSHTANATAPIGSGFDIVWSNGALTETTTVAPTTNTTYSVTVTDTATTCYSMDSVVVSINPSPVVSLGSDFDLCENETQNLDAGAGFTTYLWSNSDVTQTSDILGSDLGVGTSNVYVEVTDTNGCAGSDTVAVTVLAAPVVNLGADFTMKLSHVDTLDAGAGFNSYLWNNGWTNQTLVIDNTINQVGINVYFVEVTNSDNCLGYDTVIVDVIDDTGIEEGINLIAVNIYPNPAKTNVFVSMDGYNGNVEMELLSMTSQVIYKESLEINNSLLQKVDISSLAKGVYYIKLSTDKHSQMHKLIVQ